MIWSEALSATMLQWRDHPIEYGTFDCCQFIRDYYQLLSGKPAPVFHYSSKTEAMRLLVQHGGIEGIVTSVLGPPHNDPAPGDIVLCDLGEAPDSLLGVGVFNGDYVVGVLPDRDGVSRFIPIYVLKGWSV